LIGTAFVVFRGFVSKDSEIMECVNPDEYELAFVWHPSK
jgi:hypothetical protein